MTHLCVNKLTIIGSDNGLSPDRCQAIIRTNAGILFIGTLGILSEIHTFSFKKMHLKTSSAKRWPFCLGLNVLTHTLVQATQRLKFTRWSFSVYLHGTDIVAMHWYGVVIIHKIPDECFNWNQFSVCLRFVLKLLLWSTPNWLRDNEIIYWWLNDKEWI